MSTTTSNAWIINLPAYGAFLFRGTEAEAEDRRKHKAVWESAVALKRPATDDEANDGEIDSCPNHPNYKWPHKYACDCGKCDSKSKRTNKQI